MTANQHRWINTAIALSASLSALTVAIHDHVAVLVKPTPPAVCPNPYGPGTNYTPGKMGDAGDTEMVSVGR